MDLLTKFKLDKKSVIVTIVACSVLLLAFKLGAVVGYRQAIFASRGGERYMQVMEGGREDRFFISRGPVHGAVGRIVSVDLPTFTVVGPDNLEKTVQVNSKTAITRFRGTASTSAIQPEEMAVVLGDPGDSGMIEARFIRLMPPLSDLKK